MQMKHDLLRLKSDTIGFEKGTHLEILESEKRSIHVSFRQPIHSQVQKYVFIAHCPFLYVHGLQKDPKGGVQKVKGLSSKFR